MDTVDFTLVDREGIPVASLTWQKEAFDLLVEFLQYKNCKDTPYAYHYVSCGHKMGSLDEKDLAKHVEEFAIKTHSQREAKKKKAEAAKKTRLLKMKAELEAAGMI